MQQGQEKWVWIMDMAGGRRRCAALLPGPSLHAPSLAALGARPAGSCSCSACLPRLPAPTAQLRPPRRLLARKLAAAQRVHRDDEDLRGPVPGVWGRRGQAGRPPDGLPGWRLLPATATAARPAALSSHAPAGCPTCSPLLHHPSALSALSALSAQERLHKVYLVDAPAIFSLLFTVGSRGGAPGPGAHCCSSAAPCSCPPPAF
jgi:hypothetical protein